jgi:hypothetical protein
MTSVTVTLTVLCSPHNYHLSNCVPGEWIEFIIKPVTLTLLGV